MNRRDRKGFNYKRYWNLEPDGKLTLIAVSKDELSKKKLNKIFKKKGYI